MFVTGEIEKSVFESLCWFFIAIISLVLNVMAFNFFWHENDSWHVYKFVFINLFACNISVGCLNQILIAVVFLNDNCLLRAICFIGTIITNQFSLISFTSLSFSQYQRASKLSRGIVPEPGYRSLHIFLVSISWVYCGSIALIKVMSPKSYLPVALLVAVSSLLVLFLLLTAIKLRKVRKNVIGIENQEQQRTVVVLANQVNHASKITLILLILTILTWLPASVITLLFRFGFMLRTSQVHIAVRIGLYVLFLSPSIDVLCFLVKTPRLRRSFMQTFNHVVAQCP